MKILELKGMTSPDADVDVWEPTTNAVWLLLELEIGPRGKDGADVFEVMIATPEGLQQLATPDANGAIVTRGTIVLQRFTWQRVRTTLAAILEQCESEDWTESVEELQRFFRWEYEDYTEDEIKVGRR